MTMNGKEWKARKSDFPYDEDLKKNYNAVKYTELSTLLKGMCSKWPGDERVVTFKRKILEEVSNIIQHNKTGWTDISVWTGINPGKTKLTIEIWYNSDSYYDPIHFNNVNVIGSTDKFDYDRNLAVEKKVGETKYSINFGF